ncbi:MAG: DUF4421 domain-containing protein, partial [Treponema sp.]|nr:DUF4421 domain-containing protein [Treponema sp.]
MSIASKKWRLALLFFFIGAPLCFPQAYTPYNQKFDLVTKLSRNFIGLQDQDQSYKPNTPMSIGLGFSVKNTIINIFLGYGLDDTMKSDIGKTDFLDFQLHNYSKYFIIDLFFQQYKGFYTETGDDIVVYPDLSARQYGAEVSYLINGDKFSAKAAFGHTEKQLVSGGSFIAGTGVYLNQIEYDTDVFAGKEKFANNLRTGLTFGYAHSFVMGDHWLLSGALTGGIQFGNNIDRLKEGEITANLANLLRFSVGYNTDNWGVSLDFLGNIQYYSFLNENTFNLFSG